jgi:hypothetical protein
MERAQAHRRQYVDVKPERITAAVDVTLVA